MAAGSFPNCVLLEDGSLRCFGELVADFQKDRWSVPRYVAADLGAIKQVACGDGYICVLLEDGSLECFNTCTLLEDGSVRCFGLNIHGQCSVPTDLSTVADVPI